MSPDSGVPRGRGEVPSKVFLTISENLEDVAIAHTLFKVFDELAAVVQHGWKLEIVWMFELLHGFSDISLNEEPNGDTDV